MTVTPPPGITATVAPATVPLAAGSTTVTLSATTQAAPGDHPVTVHVRAGGVEHSTVLTLTVSAPLTTRIELSTSGDASPPGVGGHADDADVLAWDGAAFHRAIDASAPPHSIPHGADVDGFSRLNRHAFYVSFSKDVKLPGIGRVQDEDVVLFDRTRWRVWFDGTAHHLRAPSLDLDAISVVGSRLYFSTSGPVNPPGVRGAGDDADIYRWDGRAFTRVWDATAHGLSPALDVDGLDLTNRSHFALSFSNASVTLPGLGGAEDEDVVGYARGHWWTVFDGTSAGLTAPGLDIDAFDLE